MFPISKILEIYRGKSTVNFKCTNGDVYDSSSKLLEYSTGKVLDESQYVNTDSTNGYKGGRLKAGMYYAIEGLRHVSYQPDPIRVLKFFRLLDGQKIEDIKSEDDITDAMWQLPSDIPNPNHGGAMYVEVVQGHPGSESWDWSHACQTWLNYGHAHDFDKLMSHIAPKEVIIVNLLEAA